MNKQLVSIGRASELLGVCVDTLREWDKAGRLVPVKTVGNHRRYRISDIEKFKGEAPEISAESKIRVAVYARVSSHEQKEKGDLERQTGRILKYCVEKQYDIIETFEEVGSGMKDDRPKLKRLFKLVEQKKIDKIVVEHKDRLSRFMVGFLEEYFAAFDVEIEWMSEIIGTTYEQELVEDILSLMSSFSNRIYGRRSAENPDLVGARAKHRAEVEEAMKKAK